MTDWRRPGPPRQTPVQPPRCASAAAVPLPPTLPAACLLLPAYSSINGALLRCCCTENTSPASPHRHQPTQHIQVATHERQSPLPRQRPLTAAERLSRNRAAKRAVTDTTLLNHLSTLYHMNRRIYESYSNRNCSRPSTAPSRPSTAPSRPATAPSLAGVLRPPPTADMRGVTLRVHTLPPRSAGMAAAAAEATAAETIAAHHPVAPPSEAPAPPSFVRRHV